ncbi:MAG: Lpg1974 family pore-forming outer membrane protein [Pirellulaceae bacterium]|nr:Lpg1974 family pore-forming outer membrane protein [Pirellulaceae bacterium]
MKSIVLPLLVACLSLVSFAGSKSVVQAEGHDLIATSSRLAAWDVYDERLADLETQVYELAKDQGNKKSYRAGDRSVYTGFSFLFAKAHMKESFEATITNVVTPSLTLVPLDTDYEMTPRVWLGMTNDQGLGVRMTYWRYDHGGNAQTFVSDGINLPGATVTTVIFPAAIIAPVAGDVLSTSNQLATSTLDAEGTIDLQLGSLQMRAGAGLRYAKISQQMSALATRGGAPIGVLDWTREFEGIGPTISADARRPLLNDVSAIGVLRGSLLYGEKSLQRSVIGDSTPVPGPPIVQLDDVDEVTAGFEMALGVEWKREFASGHQLVVQGTYEGQLWTAAGAPTLTFLGFEGFSVSIGGIW